MDSTLVALPSGAGVALLRLRSLGDTVLMTPALAALNAWRPDLRLAAVVETRFADALAGNAGVAEVIALAPGASGRWAAIQSLRRFRPALAVGLHGGSTAAILARASGAKQRASFLGLRHRWAYNLLTPPQAPPPGRQRLHTVEQVASLFHALGLPSVRLGPSRVFPQPAARQRMRQRLAAHGIGGGFAILNPEAREPGMRWPLERFGELASWLRRERGWACVQASAAAGTRVAGATLLSGTTVQELIALIAESELVVGSDGGPVHLAAALGKPVLALYSTTDVEVWSPWQAQARWLQADPLAALPFESARAALDALLAAASA
ncbi:MAG: glycosyltransferase family 9 protein [Terriglobales bacterium]